MIYHKFYRYGYTKKRYSGGDENEADDCPSEPKYHKCEEGHMARSNDFEVEAMEKFQTGYKVSRTRTL